MKAEKLPARISVLNYKYKIEVRDCPLLEDPYHVKLYIRQLAKIMPIYHTPVSVDVDNDIPVNTLGRWLFGVPGYMGHYAQRVYDDHVEILLPSVNPRIDTMMIRLITEPLIKYNCKTEIKHYTPPSPSRPRGLGHKA